jgi:hypothetical protein
MNALKKAGMILGAMGLALAMSQASHAQALNSTVANVNLNATLNESITVSASPATVNFTLVPNGVAPGSSNVTVITSWALKTTRKSVNVYAYFSSANALTDGGSDIIPNTSVSGSINGGAAAPFTTGTPFGGNFGLAPVFTQVVGAATTFNNTHTDSIALSISTVGLNLPAATYTGVLNIEAQAL